MLLSTHNQLKILAITSVLAFWIVGGTFAIGWVTCKLLLIQKF